MKTEPVSTTEMLANDQMGGSADVLSSLGGLQMADYELTERLGAGGYGEVWKAIGPGGLPKAVKILYGEQDGDHAEAELKALQRMRELRHPFLLSIERIEVVNARLIVVTELADGNLSDRFEACRRDSKAGIPRDELLGYLRDAADALDYMAEQHGLQHLDIKPDNLLLQGGHVKVGDFGLAKDISTTNVSVLNGFTPMFAAPELFEGRPGRASDQYSLAIVYQMMLTGLSPFNGRTAAQLTAQHLRSQPDLTSLQPIDRPVIARALSKNVNSRFDNCAQFVAELTRRKHGRSANRAYVPVTDDDVSDTALLKTVCNDSVQPVPGKDSTPVSISPVSTDDATLRPSVVIGVGGLAGLVLKRFKTRFCDNSVAACPFPILQIDTDRETLTALKLKGDDSGLSAEETLSIPLRSSNDYRSASELDLSWLSRRWLFNIPRSGKVEGIRPLGRLALCDHKKSVEARLQKLLQEAISAELREAVRELTELPIAEQGLDVYVVAATTGGTSSGSLADIGLMVKHALRTSGIRNSEVHGILLHGTGAMRNVTDVQEANTVCVLRELRHLSTPGLGTPRGFETSGIQSDIAPFDHTSFVHLGDGLNEDVFHQRANDVADNLFLRATTAAQLDFRQWSQQSDDEAKGVAQLRILNMDSQDESILDDATEDAGNLTSLLLRRWAGSASSHETGSQQELPAELSDTETLLAELHLTEDTLPKQVVTLLRGQIGKSIESYAAELHGVLRNSVDVKAVTQSQVLDFLGQQISQRPTAGMTNLHGIIFEVQTKLTSITRNCERAMTAHLTQLLDSPHRIAGTVAATTYSLQALQDTKKSCGQLLEKIEGAFANMTTIGEDPSFSSEVALQEFCKQYCILLAYQTIHKCFVNHVVAVSTAVETIANKINSVKTEFADLGAAVADVQAVTDAIPQPVVDAFDRSLRTSAPTLVADLYAGAYSSKECTAKIMKLSRKFLVSTSNGEETADSEEKEFPATAWPVFRRVGGRRRVLGSIPKDMESQEWRKTLKAEFGDCVAVRSTDNPMVSVVCEIEGVPMESVIMRLTGSNPHISDVADRIHTRIDVEW